GVATVDREMKVCQRYIAQVFERTGFQPLNSGGEIVIDFFIIADPSVAVEIGRKNSNPFNSPAGFVVIDKRQRQVGNGRGIGAQRSPQMLIRTRYAFAFKVLLLITIIM